MPTRTVTRVGMKGFDLLPQDVILNILEIADHNPVRFAGVQRSWRWLLDNEDSRDMIYFSYTNNYRYTLHEAARSLALFVCRRPPTTHVLFVRLGHSQNGQDPPEANAALGAVLTHLAPSLHVVDMEPFTTADAFTTSPFTDMCTSLYRVRAHVNNPVDLSFLQNLVSVDLAFSGPRAEHVKLPPQLEVLRVQVYTGASRNVLTQVLHSVDAMSELLTLAVYSDYAYTVDLAALPCSLRTLVLGGTDTTKLRVNDAHLPELVVLGLQDCRFVAADLRAMLLRATNIVSLQLETYRIYNHLVDPQPHFDLRHLPLKAINLTSSYQHSRITCMLPDGIVKATLGKEDLMDALLQPALASSVRELVVDLNIPCRHVFEYAWPANISLPNLRRVVGIGCVSVHVGAVLGQRCAGVEVELVGSIAHDIENDLV